MEVVEDDKQINFQYANECDLEIHCSPFGLSGLYIKVKGTNIMGVGSTMGLITGSTKGLIHYNDSQDLMDQKYKLYVLVEDDGMLRIDFTKITPLSNTTDELLPYKPTAATEADKGAIDTKSPISTAEESSSYSSSLKSPQNPDKGETVTSQESEANIGEDVLPSLIFRGKCPDGRPDNIEPFIGIFSFERED